MELHLIVGINFYNFLFCCYALVHFLKLIRRYYLLNLQFNSFLTNPPKFLILNSLFSCRFFKEFKQ